jgi:cell division protein FtsI/penicillin-binding protein 2
LNTARNNKNFLNKSDNKFRWYYFALLALLGVWAVPTVNHYIYPKDKEVFYNADYHVLEHKGFVFDSLLHLVRSNYPSNDFPDEAIWDNKTGSIILTHDSIGIQNYFEPFFVANKFENHNLWDKFLIRIGTKDDSNYYRLCNKIISIDISNGFTLVKGGEILYSLQIVPFEENDRNKCYYISQSAHSPADTSSFTQQINIGYPITDIIAHSSNFKFSDELRELFDGAVLVRENIPIDNIYGREKRKDNQSALVLMPNSTFFTDNELQINGTFVSHDNPNDRFVIPIEKEKIFYSGIGRTKTDIIRIKPEEKNMVSLRYVLPKMQKLRKHDGRLFITSSIDEAVGAKIDGGYLYNIFESEKNFNHINARIRYFVGSSRDSLFVETMDLYAENPTEKNIITADNEFFLQTRGKVNHDVQWIFNLKNLRETNALQWGHILWFIVIFILLVGLRFFIDNAVNTKSLSILELSVYVVVFCFSIVRLVLGWRMSTFVPLEDIDATVFAKMRNGISVWVTTCFSLALPLLFQGFSFIKKSPDILEKIKEKLLNISYIWFFMLFAGILGSCYLGSKIDFLNRFLIIPTPIITFFLFNMWLLIKQENEEGYSFKRILPQVSLWIITLLYLFIQDAGFSIIFLMYSIIQFFIIVKVIDKRKNRFKPKEFFKNKVVAITFFSVIFFLFLLFEGDLLIFIFDYFGFVVLVISLVLVGLLFYWFKKEYINKWIVFISIGSLGLLFILSILDITEKYNGLSNFANSKAHIKFRAEVQKLKSNEAIDDLMLKSDFNSEDIAYIMRSAHNQWFINQYNNDTIADTKYFKLQPHFNQGSTFTTQTTDLVITRYVLAEHGECVLFWLMLMLLLLLLIYCYDVRLESKTNFTILGVFILLFVIALFVFLSATNRIVFFGQDFPFLSITSRIAVLFPIGLFSIAVWKTIIDNQNTYSDNSKVQESKIWIPLILISLTLACVKLIPPQGKNQNEDQFNVSKIISNVTDKIELLDREFVKFQIIKETNIWPMDSVWNAYTNPANEEFSHEWKAAVNDSSSSNMFFNSLLRYFDEKQAEKNNPEELLHLRKRNGLYRLCINKKHYFIPSVMQEDIQWTGEILAAKTDRYFGFSKISSTGIKERLNTNTDYELDVLPSIIHSQVSNIRILRFDTSWVADKEPLLLITSKQSKGRKQFYHIETESMSIKGNSTDNQLATRIKQNDLVLLNTIDEKGVEKNVLGWKYGQDDEHFLAKNLWLNGRRQLFYPLGKESMWSYNFANLVANTYGNIPEYRDSTIRVSIDYDLHKQFYSIINSENKSKIILNEATINQLITFKESGYQKQKSTDSRMLFHYDVGQSQIVYDKVNTDLKKGIDRVNLILKKLLRTKSPELAIIEAIDEVVEKRFDYSAVVIDGNGRIRALFDYSKNRKIDPNNIKYLNRFLSNLYKESDNSSERDVFGNNALQLLIPGPGSSFKPIAYTAITSQQQLPWETLEVSTSFLNEALHINIDKNETNTNKKFDYYGGVKCSDVNEEPWSIDYNSALAHNNYIIYSNNLYHSVIIMIGNQRTGHWKDILKPVGTDAYSFPVFTLNGAKYSFNREKWYKDGNMEVGQGIMSLGLKYNFNIYEEMVSKTNLYSNFFGQESYLSILFGQKSDWRGWAYAETGSQNNTTRNLPPFIRNGLIHMSLGAPPLEVSPLQMTTMTMRLATLNRSKNITTLSDYVTQVPNYEFFQIPTWSDSLAYFNFYKRQVFGQLRQVPKVGTAKGLSQLVLKYEAQGYYFYAKTGTLNLNDKGKERIKNLLVIISNTPLENIGAIADLKKVKYYALYLSYIGIDEDEFGSTSRFGKIISATVESELFQKYMNSK